MSLFKPRGLPRESEPSRCYSPWLDSCRRFAAPSASSFPASSDPEHLPGVTIITWSTARLIFPRRPDCDSRDLVHCSRSVTA